MRRKDILDRKITDIYDVTEETSIQRAVYSINRDVTKIKELMNKSFELQRCLNFNNKSDCKNGTYYTFDTIIGGSQALKDVMAAAKKIAQNNSLED